MTPPRAGGLATNTAWNALDTAVGAIGAIVNSVLVARALGPTILGRYQFILWGASIVSVLTLYGVPASANRYLARYIGRGQLGAAGAVMRTALRWQLLLMVVVIGSGAVFAFLRAPSERLVVGIVFLGLIPALLQAIPTGLNGVDERFSRNVIPSVTGEVLATLGVIWVVTTGGGLVGLAAVTTGARWVDAACRFLLARQRMTELWAAAEPDFPIADRKDFREMVWQSVIVQILAFVVWNRSEILFLEIFSTSEQLAFYSISFGLIMRLRVVAGAAVRAQTPRILKQHGVDPLAAAALTTTSMRQQLLLTAPLYLLAFAFADDAVKLLYGPQYLAAIPIMMIMAILTIPGAVAAPIEALLTAADGQRSLLRILTLSAAITLLADAVLIALLDGIGAGIANGIAFVAQGGLLMFFASRRAGLALRGLGATKIFVVATIAVLVARAVTWSMPPLPALLVGGPLAILAYGALLRWSGVLTPGEAGQIGRLLSTWMPERFIQSRDGRHDN